jgi:hypothetical protein
MKVDEPEEGLIDGCPGIMAKGPLLLLITVALCVFFAGVSVIAYSSTPKFTNQDLQKVAMDRVHKEHGGQVTGTDDPLDGVDDLNDADANKGEGHIIEAFFLRAATLQHLSLSPFGC